MSKEMFSNLKDIGIAFSIIASIIGASMAYGKHNEEIKQTKHVLAEVKKDRKDEMKEVKQAIQENTEVNVRQTAILENITYRLEKLDK